MKNKLIFNLILLLMVASGWAHTPAIAKEAEKPDAAVASDVTTGTPALDVPEWYFDFGEVKEWADYTHAFVIRNKGTGVLEIKKVQPG
ncbi:MAG: hypothetical protein ABSH41_26320 [Syntrophobacteraceae bacterium]